jgi:hypothetical protein
MIEKYGPFTVISDQSVGGYRIECRYGDINGILMPFTQPMSSNVDVLWEVFDSSTGEVFFGKKHSFSVFELMRNDHMFAYKPSVVGALASMQPVLDEMRTYMFMVIVEKLI